MFRKIAIISLCIFSQLVGCGGLKQTPDLIPIRLPVGYIPNIQFAPLYVAIEKGYFRDAGLDVTVDYSMENDNAVLLANNTIQFSVLSGEQVMLARSQTLPLVYVMAWYQQYPVGIVSKQVSGINTVADLKGKKIGLPGLFGASYIGAIALLDSAGLTESDVTLDSIGFNQVEVLVADRDDAVVVYAANEPVQLENLGESINLLKVSDAVDLVANGLVTNEKTLIENPNLVKAMVTATLKGIDYTMAHPEEAFEISTRYVENLANTDQVSQKQVLTRSIEQWKSERLGYSQPVAWENMQRILIKMGLMSQPIEISKCFTNEFIPE
jgi:NitT/TauT family transport system substrate-binding protein